MSALVAQWRRLAILGLAIVVLGWCSNIYAEANTPTEANLATEVNPATEASKPIKVNRSKTNRSTSLYKFVDNRGHVRYTDRPPHDGYVKLEKTWKGWRDLRPHGNYRANLTKYKPLVQAFARKYELPPWLVQAIIHAESYYNPHAVSQAGAVGLMQLMPGTARRYGVSNRQNVEQNVEGGTRYLRDLLDMFEGNLDLALAAYNAGENAVKKYGNKIPPYEETQKYVVKVKALSLRYQSQPG